MVLKHIVLDCDGVLWQGTNEGYFRCYHQAASDAGIHLEYEVAKERILANWGQSPRREILGMIPDAPRRVDEVLRRYERLVRSNLFLDTASLVPGTSEALRTLSASFRLSAITGMQAENLDVLLDRFGLRSYFCRTISTIDSEDPARQKHTGYHLGLLIQSEGLAPDQALCVGDARSDVEMANRQKVPVVVVCTGHLSQEEARRMEVADVLPSIASLPSWLGMLRT